MEMNYFKKTGKMMVAACMLAGLPFIPGTVSASELQTNDVCSNGKYDIKRTFRFDRGKIHITRSLSVTMTSI